MGESRTRMGRMTVKIASGDMLIHLYVCVCVGLLVVLGGGKRY